MKTTNVTLGLGLLAIAAHSPVSLATENDAQSIPEVLVTAKTIQPIDDVLATAHVFTLADIEAIQPRDLPDLLDHIAGISVRDSGGRGSVTDVFVRGTSNTQLVVLIDGVRVGSATLGAAALNTYPVEAIERIEVIKGPLAGIYGADAVGGVIQLFTKKGRDGSSAAYASTGSDSLFEYGIGFSGGDERFSYHVSAASEETDGIDRTSITSGGNDDIDGYEESAYSIGAFWQVSDATSLNLSVLYSDNESQFDNTFGNDIGDFSATTSMSTALQLRTQVSDSLTLNTVLGINEDESATFSSFPSVFETERDNIGADVQYSLSEQSSLTVGFDYYEEHIVSSTNYPIDERDNKAIFALYQAQRGNFGVLASARYDDNSAYGSDTNSSLALSYALDENTEVIASYGTAFVAPSFNFLYFPFFGNPDLKPEESDSLELGLRGQADALAWRVSFYDTKVENLFSFDPNTFLAANVGTAELKGVEIQTSLALADWMLEASLDILSAENLETGRKLDDRAEHTVRLSAARDWNKSGLRLDIKGEGNRFDSGGQELTGHLLFDVSGYYEFNDALTLRAAIDNVFDTDYTVNLIGLSERYNTLGRQARVTLRYTF